MVPFRLQPFIGPSPQVLLCFVFLLDFLLLMTSDMMLMSTRCKTLRSVFPVTAERDALMHTTNVEFDQPSSLSTLSIRLPEIISNVASRAHA